MTKTAEIVTFRLAGGTDTAAFIAAAQQMTPFLQSTEACLGRTLSVDDDGLWTDHVLWDSLEAAQALAAQFMDAPETADARALIDGETIVMRHAAVHMQKG